MELDELFDDPDEVIMEDEFDIEDAVDMLYEAIYGEKPNA